MSYNEKEKYFVAVKLFLTQNKKLLILKDNFGDWDLPGGRIKTDEHDIPLKQIIKRKISEELGVKTKYKLGEPVVFMRHQRIERTPGNPVVRIFAIGYKAILENNEINLSERHTEMLWVDPIKFNPSKYFKGGWLKGIEEYIEIYKTHN